MKLSQEALYGIEALAYLARESTRGPVHAIDVAAGAGVPAAFLAKIFQKLAAHDILRSHRGRTRGYTLARPPRAIHIREILEAIEGPDLFERCMFWSNRCADTDTCPLHEAWKTVKAEFVRYTERGTLADLMGAMPRTSGRHATRRRRSDLGASL